MSNTSFYIRHSGETLKQELKFALAQIGFPPLRRDAYSFTEISDKSWEDAAGKHSIWECITPEGIFTIETLATNKGYPAETIKVTIKESINNPEFVGRVVDLVIPLDGGGYTVTYYLWEIYSAAVSGELAYAIGQMGADFCTQYLSLVQNSYPVIHFRNSSDITFIWNDKGEAIKGNCMYLELHRSENGFDKIRCLGGKNLTVKKKHRLFVRTKSKWVCIK